MTDLTPANASTPPETPIRIRLTFVDGLIDADAVAMDADIAVHRIVTAEQNGIAVCYGKPWRAVDRATGAAMGERSYPSAAAAYRAARALLDRLGQAELARARAACAIPHGGEIADRPV